MRDAVIFDMDGLLLDTETIALRTFQEICSQQGLPFNRAVYNQCLGCNMPRATEILKEGVPGFEADVFIPLWESAYHADAVEKPVPLKDGVEVFLQTLADHNIPCAVATSSGWQKARRKLENAQIIDRFQAILTGDQVADSKPHPEIYQKAAAAINTDPKNCLALEDSDNGVRAAFSAGMLVYQIPDLVPPGPAVQNLGHRVRASIKDVHQEFLTHAQL